MSTSRLAAVLHLPPATIIEDDQAPQPAGPTAADFVSAGITYRELDYWTRTGRLRTLTDATPGQGHGRMWQPGEVEVAALTKRLTDAGLKLDVAFTVARGQHQIGPGIALVIDQEEPC